MAQLSEDIINEIVKQCEYVSISNSKSAFMLNKQICKTFIDSHNQIINPELLNNFKNEYGHLTLTSDISKAILYLESNLNMNYILRKNIISSIDDTMTYNLEEATEEDKNIWIPMWDVIYIALILKTGKIDDKLNDILNYEKPSVDDLCKPTFTTINDVIDFIDKIPLKIKTDCGL